MDEITRITVPMNPGDLGSKELEMAQAHIRRRLVELGVALVPDNIEFVDVANEGCDDGFNI